MPERNDPRVFFAAQRTLLAWSRTSLTLKAFGFVIERFGLFLRMLLPHAGGNGLQRGVSFWIGLAFILLGALAAILSSIQYRNVVRTLSPNELPVGHRNNMELMLNLAVAVLGIALMVYLFMHGSML